MKFIRTVHGALITVIAVIVVLGLGAFALSNVHVSLGNDSARADGPDASPTASPSIQSSPATSGVQIPDSQTTCPTDAQMQAAFGFDKMNPPIKPVATGGDIAWEGCKWNLQWVSNGTLQLPMLKGWEFTVTEPNDTVSVWYGDGKIHPVKGATIRWLKWYHTSANKWVNDGCELLKREINFGQDPKRGNTYDTVQGNVCVNGVSSTTDSVTTAQPTAAATTAAAKCPTTPSEAATLLSGGKGTWDPHDDAVKGKIWILQKSDSPVDLKWPGFGSFDYWGATPVNGNQKDISGATGGATFNCS